MTGAMDTAKTLFVKLEAGDWLGAARLFNPLQLDEWYHMLLQRRPKDEDVGLTVDQFRKHRPDMPREVAEYHIAQMRKAHASRSPLDDLYGVATWEDAEKLGAAQAYGLHLRSRDPRQQFQRDISRQSPGIAADIDLRAIAIVHRILGAVEETNTLVHVVYRRYWGEDDHSGSLHLLTCSKEGQWMVEMTTEWEMAQSSYAICAEAFEEKEISALE